MNATFGEVLRKVLTGFIIIEPDMERFELEEDALEQRGFWDGVGVVLRLGAMCRLSEREREREREREKHQSIDIPKREKRMVRMHDHITCTKNIIMGSAQSKPTSTQDSNMEDTHL